MIKKVATIKNKLGLHARPASLFVKTAGMYKSKVVLVKDGIEVDGKSIMGVLMLGAEKDSQIEIKVDGEDEKEALEAILSLIEGKFDEE
ncbi:MAG TPA: HPr family phosphocarrier protein [bacterium (Candidatus Stahlbacteria)]|nr:HPr family phosphocarrier protein [Candidatus Stahlbacteria bacterium]